MSGASKENLIQSSLPSLISCKHPEPTTPSGACPTRPSRLSLALLLLRLLQLPQLLHNPSAERSPIEFAVGAMASLAAVGNAAAAVAVPTLAPAVVASNARKPSKVVVRKMSSFGGIRPENQVTKLGSRESTEHHFARVVAQCYAASRSSRGGAAASTCNVASEIFKVVPIMSALVLIGIALGFVLLRIEAAVEESE